MESARQQAQPEVSSTQPATATQRNSSAKQPHERRVSSFRWVVASAGALLIAGLSVTMLDISPKRIFAQLAPLDLDAAPSPVDILRNELQVDRPQYQRFAVHTSLGRVFLADGRLAEAVVHFGEAVGLADSMSERVEARLLLAMAQRRQGRLGDARELLKAALAFADLETEGVVLHALAEVRAELGHFEAAIKLFDRAFGFTDQNDMDRLALLSADIAEAWACKGQLRQSMSWLGSAEQALQFSQYSLSGMDEEVAAKVARRLGAVQLRLGDIRLAMEAYRRALRVQQRLLHPSHPELVASQLGAARALHGLGDSAGAIRNVEAVEEALRHGLQDSLELSKALRIKADMLSEANHIAAAELAIQEALQSQTALLQGQYHPETASALSCYAGILHKSGKPNEAHGQYKMALEISVETVGEEHPATAALHKKLGMLQEELGDDGAAREHLSKCLEIHLDAFGATSLDTAQARVDLATLLARQGQQLEAADLLEQALRKLDDEELPQEHPVRATHQEALGAIRSFSVN